MSVVTNDAMADNHHKPLYFENLDGLRFIAFFAVFISHASLFLGYDNNSYFYQLFKKYILVNGDVGVSFFFVLSGFLITYLLIREKDNNGKVSLKSFYLKRILRIWPVYFTTLIVGFFILPVIARLIIGSESFVFLMNPLFSVLPNYIFFLANFNGALSTNVPTAVLWSVSVEEQFYLVWPFVIAFLPRKHLLKFLSTIILISCLYRYFYAFFPDMISYSTFSVMSDLAVGSVLAYLLYTKNNLMDGLFSKIKVAPKKIIALLYTFLILIIAGRHYATDALISHSIFYSLFVSIFPLILASTYALIIFEQNESSGSIFKIGRSKILTSLGKISYGLYSYHMIAFVIVLLSMYCFGIDIWHMSIINWFISMGLSLTTVYVLATLSYYGMEKYFLSKKPKH
ncbi:MAG: acyltransferase [bacterium]